MVAREVTAMQESPVGADELTRVKACLLRQLPLTEASLEQIAHGLLARSDLGLPLDEPTAAGSATSRSRRRRSRARSASGSGRRTWCGSAKGPPRTRSF